MPENFLDNILASSIVLLAFMVIMGTIYTVWSYFKLRKKRKYFEGVHTELAPGQEVVFGGGIFGKVRAIHGEKVQIEVRSGAVMDVSRYAIQQIDDSKGAK